LVWGPPMINLYHRPYKWGLSSMTPTRKDSWLWVPQVRNLYKSVLPQLQHYYNTTTDLPQHYDNTTTVVVNTFNTLLLLQWDYSSTTTRLLQYTGTTDEESFWWGPHKEPLIWTPQRRIIDYGSHT
jgi:hypothetical protein